MDKLYIHERRLNACGAIVGVGTTGNKGGDAGHSGKTYIEIQKHPFLDINYIIGDDSLVIDISGDAELAFIIETCKYILEKLDTKKQVAGDAGSWPI